MTDNAQPTTEAALLSDSPRARWHREEHSDARTGWSSWRCIPIADAIQARAESAAKVQALREAARLVIRADSFLPMNKRPLAMRTAIVALRAALDADAPAETER